MGVVNIYSLRDSQELRYVGKTKNTLKRRLQAHLSPSKNQKATYKSNWIKVLEKKPKIELLDVVQEKEWEFWEKYWISQMKTWGFNLVNGDEGGTGGHNAWAKGKKLKPNPNQIASVKGNTYRRGCKHENYEAVRNTKLKLGLTKSVSNGSITFITGWEAAKEIIKSGKSKGTIKIVYNKIYEAIKRNGSAYGYKWKFKTLKTN